MRGRVRVRVEGVAGSFRATGSRVSWVADELFVHKAGASPVRHVRAMAASAKSRAALFQLSQIRALPIRCELHQDQGLEASGQPRFSASIAFGSQHAHSGAAWFESGPQAEEASGHGSKRGTPSAVTQTG